MYIILVLLLVFIGLFLGIGWFLSGDKYKGPKSDHFDGKRFINPNQLEAQNLAGVFKYMTKREPEPWKKNYETFVRDKAIIPRYNKPGTHLIFVNHSTFLIQFAGLNILTDPVWSERCSPFQFAGPKRMRPPGIKFEDLPPIDLVLLSHNHYDHLDKQTIIALEKNHSPQFVVPLGLTSLMHKFGCKEIVELDWGESLKWKDLEIESTPASHFSSRGMFDRDATLWCGFLIRNKDFQIYYVGDTGYGDNFKKLAKKHTSIDLALIPIGAYKPEWFMGPIHVSPKQSVQVHQDLRVKQSVAMHFGTFPLADDGQGVAQADLKFALQEAGIPAEEFIIPDEGFSYLFS